MNLMDYEEFVEYYNKNGKLPFPLSTPKVKMGEFQLKAKYNDYCRRLDKDKKKPTFAETLHPEISNKPKKSSYAQSVEDAMDRFRAKNDRSVFLNYYRNLNQEQRKVIDSELWMCPVNPETKIQTWDVAHIIERGENQALADKEFNFVLLPRNFHHHIDFYENPLTPQHERITREQHDQIWMDLIGRELWDKLINYKD